MRRCVITGASGFIGRAVVQRLRTEEGISVQALVRQGGQEFPNDVTVHSGFDLSTTTDWNPILFGADCVIHAAAHVHVMQVDSVEAPRAFHSVNVEGTLNLGRQAAQAGVRRFIFVSSIKVNGEYTDSGHPFTPADVPSPSDDYGLSKYKAEEGLRLVASRTEMEIVVIRPPLVYGPGVKANFLSLVHWLINGVPLPLGAVNNRRSLVALDNLVDLIAICIDHPAAANEIFLVSDDEDVSTSDLLRRMGRALGKPARLFPVPAGLLSTGALLLGRREWLRRLCGNLQVDISKTKRILGWRPPISVDEALSRAAAAYRSNLAEK